MSIPNIIYGDFGDEKITSATRMENLPLGAVMVLPDGEEFSYGKASATAMVAGKLYQQDASANVTGSTDGGLLTNMVVAGDAAIGATTISLTMGATAAFTKDQLRDGYLLINDSTGAGLKYKIRENAAAASLGTLALTLYPNDKIKVALVAGTSQVGLRQNEWDNLTITTADTVGVGALAGVPPVAIPASNYGWIQRKGVCAGFTDGTLVVGEPVVVGTAVTGAFTVYAPAAADTTGARVVKESTIVGYCMNVSASTEYSLIKLMLP